MTKEVCSDLGERGMVTKYYFSSEKEGVLILSPNATIAKHGHEEHEYECWKVLSGKVRINGDIVSAGEGRVCKEGAQHALENFSFEDVAILLFMKWKQ